MRIYIAGPIAGYPNGNREAFAERAEMIIAAGWEPVNPHEVDHAHEGACIGVATDRPDDPHLYGCYLRADIRELMTCDAYTLLRGWYASKGARVERHVAQALGIPLRMGSIHKSLAAPMFTPEDSPAMPEISTRAPEIPMASGRADIKLGVNF